MELQNTEKAKLQLEVLPSDVRDELAWYEEQIRNYLAGELDETKMQKVRLHFGTYAQRQEGVQMQRIKFPGGFLKRACASCRSGAVRVGPPATGTTTRTSRRSFLPWQPPPINRPPHFSRI